MPSPNRFKLNRRWPLRLPEYRRKQWSQGWEERRLDAVRSVVSDGDVVYDVGAETGDMSALYASWGAHVVVVEPALALWPMIRDVFELNDLRPYLNLPVFAAAETTFQLGEWSVAINWPDASEESISPEHPGFRHLDEQPSTADRIRLDDIKGARPDVVTVDVEGSELEVIAGATDLIEHRETIWFVAVHPQFIRDRWDADWKDVLHAFDGYTATLLDAHHEQHWMFVP